MRITDVRLEKVRIELVKPFRIAIGVIEDFTPCWSRCTPMRICGLGRARPWRSSPARPSKQPWLRGEIKRLVMVEIPGSGGAHALMDPAFPNPSARAAFDLAFTIFAPAANLPLYKYLQVSAVPSKTMSLWL